MIDREPIIVYGITKQGNYITSAGILNDKFEHVTEEGNNTYPKESRIPRYIHFKRPRKFLFNESKEEDKT